MTPAKPLPDVKAIKACGDGDRVSFRARALRLWEVGGPRMCLAGDESALTRVEVGSAEVVEGCSYEFRDALVREHPSASLPPGSRGGAGLGGSGDRTGAGGWHSVSIAEGGQAVPLAEEVPISQDEAYIEFTYKILSGVQRKRGRKEGRLPPWQHPGKAEADPPTEGRAKP